MESVADNGLYSDRVYEALYAAADSGRVTMPHLLNIASDLQIDLEHVVAHAWDLVSDEMFTYDATAAFEWSERGRMLVAAPEASDFVEVERP